MNAADLMPETLLVAIPLWIDEMRDWSPEGRCARARECVRLMFEAPNGGAELMFKIKGETGVSFNRLAEGIACAAYQPGGIRAFGIHWCATHQPWGARSESMVCPRCLDEEAA